MGFYALLNSQSQLMVSEMKVYMVTTFDNCGNHKGIWLFNVHTNSSGLYWKINHFDQGLEMTYYLVSSIMLESQDLEQCSTKMVYTLGK